MAAALLKLMVLSLCLNTFLYLGVNYAMYDIIPPEQRPDIQDDLFSIMLSDKEGSQDAMDQYVESLQNDDNATFIYKFNISSEFSKRPNPQSGADVSNQEGGFSFLDSLNMVMAFINTLWRIATMPIQLFNYNLLPPIATFIIAFPLLLLNIITIIVLMRGGGAT